jgi:hypothetical protein
MTPVPSVSNVHRVAEGCHGTLAAAALLGQFAINSQATPTTVSGKSNVPAQGWLQGWEQGGKYMYNTSKLPFSMSTLRRDHVLTTLRYNFEQIQQLIKRN